MTVYLNGRFVDAEAATVSVFDRGFLYGDGLFETIRAYDGRPFLWHAHLGRLEQGLAALRIRLPMPAAELRGPALELLGKNGLRDAILRIAVSRGVGRRGYSPREADAPTVVMTTFSAPPLDDLAPGPWSLRTSIHRVPCGDPLSAVKTASKVLYVIARAEAEAAGADESLILNTAGRIAEATSANVFWFQGAALCTPALNEGALAGVTRGLVLELARELGWDSRETAAAPEGLFEADGVFLTLSSLGLVEADRLNDRPLRRDPRIELLRARHTERIRNNLYD